MKAHMRIFWLVALVFFTAGCSGYRVVCQPESTVPGEAENHAREFCGLKPGDKIRINLAGGESVEGVVQSVSSHELVLMPAANHDDPVGFAFSDIISIDEARSYTVYKIAGVVLLAATVIIGAKAIEGYGP